MTQPQFAEVMDRTVTSIARYETSLPPSGSALGKIVDIARERAEIAAGEQRRRLVRIADQLLALRTKEISEMVASRRDLLILVQEKSTLAATHLQEVSAKHPMLQIESALEKLTQIQKVSRDALDHLVKIEEMVNSVSPLAKKRKKG